ncbi:MAG: hypothetical protein ACXWPM_04335 [Bdellovibrionota bacterium]
MSKPVNGTAEKTKETHKPAEGGAPKAGGGGGGGGHSVAPPSKATKGHTPMPDGCHSWSCKAKATRFNFCDEHYDHFKFGLIKKTGEPVSDYEKKFEHYMAHQTKKKGAQKVA